MEENVMSLSVSFISSLIQQILTDNSSVGICSLVIAYVLKLYLLLTHYHIMLKSSFKLLSF